LLQRGHTAELEPAIKVKFKGVVVGNYAADLLVDGKVIVELNVTKNTILKMNRNYLMN